MKDLVYYRSSLSGQRGYLIETAEGPKIQHDTPRERTIVKFTSEWQPEIQRPPMNRVQACRVAYAADRELSRWFGDPVDSRKDWMNIDDDKRIDFCKNGPDAGNTDRQRVFAFILEALGCSDK